MVYGILDKPWNIQIGITRGCNKSCHFCGIRSLDKEERKIRFMTLEMAEMISKDLGSWLKKKRVEFALYGEPLIHPNLYKIFEIFRNNMDSFQFTIFTNGIKCNSSIIKNLFEVGVNAVIIENYGGNDEYNRYIEEYSDFKIHSYYKSDSSYNMYKYNGNKHNVLVILNDISEFNKIKMSRTIYNHGGNMSPDSQLKYFGYEKLPKPLKKKCVYCFKELVIDYDGTVTLCCVDWCRKAIIDIFSEDKSFEDIWNSKIFITYRQLLNDKKRVFTPCNLCNYFGGFRVGLFNVDMNGYEYERNISIIKENYNKFNEFHLGNKKFEVIKEKSLEDYF